MPEKVKFPVNLIRKHNLKVLWLRGEWPKPTFHVAVPQSVSPELFRIAFGQGVVNEPRTYLQVTFEYVGYKVFRGVHYTKWRRRDCD